MKQILKFEKNNCAPCQAVSAILEELKLSWESINPFDQPAMAMKNRVRTVPCVILLEDGKELSRVTGYKPEDLRNMLREF